MRVWFVSELYYPEETSTGHILTSLAEGLAAGRDVGVLCAQPTYAARGTFAPRIEHRNGVEIRRCRATTFNKDSLPGRIVNAITISIGLFSAALRHIKTGDVVIVVTNPPAMPYLVLAACRLRRAKSALLIHDVYPDALYVAGLLRRHSVIGFLAEWIGTWPYRIADRLIVVGRDMSELVARKLARSKSKIVMIPNWADAETVRPSDRAANPLLLQLGLTHRWVVQCSGNMGRTHGLESVVDAAERLVDADPSVHLLIVGSGAGSAMLDAAARKLPNVTAVGRRPRSDLDNLLNACDVGLVCLAEGMSGVSVPSRMYNILAAGKPIIAVAGEESEVARVIREHKVGWVVPPGRPDLLAEAIRASRIDLSADPGMAQRARHFAEGCSRRAAIAAYDDMITNLVLPEATARVKSPDRVSARRSA